MHNLHVGIDAGGTSIDLAWEAGGRQGALVLPGVNVKRDGLEEAAARIARSVDRARDESGNPRSPVSVVAGMAGVSDDNVRDAVMAKTASLAVPVQRVEIMSDAELALFAGHGRVPGAIIVVGTGSIVTVRDHAGRVFSRGGLGYILGDEASGFAIGRAAVRLLARELDAGDVSPIGKAIAAELAATDRSTLLRRVYDEQFGLSNLATLVVDLAASGDPQAEDILEQELSAFAATVHSANSHRADSHRSLNVCLMGGLAKSKYFQTLLIERVVPSSWVVVSPRYARPSDAALQLAMAT